MRSTVFEEEDEGPLSDDEEKTVQKIELTAEQKKQLKASARLMTHYTGVAGTTKKSLQQRHTLVHYEPFVTAMGKLGRAAVMFNGDSADGGYSRALNSEVMTASRLNTFLTQCFNVKLTAEELGATMRWMDYDGNGTIDGFGISARVLEVWGRRAFAEPARGAAAREGPSAAAARGSSGLDDPFFYCDAGDGHADVHGAGFEGGRAIVGERGRGFGYGFRPLAHDPRPGF